MPEFAVILPAAGSSTRFGRDKLHADLAGKEVLAHTLLAFLRRADVTCVVMPMREQIAALDNRPSYFNLISEDKRFHWCQGGATRAESVLNALRTVPESIEWVAVHDAARPLVSQALIDKVFAAAIEHGAAAPALPVNLTIKQAAATLPAKVQRTVPRDQLWALQTPQVMRRAAFLRAYESCRIPMGQVTDDLQLLELAGEAVWLIPGEDSNLKITKPLDLRLAELLLQHPHPAH